MTSDLHAAVTAAINARAGQLWDVAMALHAEPETAFAEHRAATLLTDALAFDGFEVQRGVAGLPTAFTGEAGSGSPRVALLLEYDALPGLGHACGHNLIAAAGLAAALGVRPVLDEVAGSLLVVGSPAEEGGGGKITELEAGLFEGVDAALMFHPGTQNWSWAPLTAQAELEVTVHGRAAHPTGNPTEGRDALAALIQVFNSLAVLCQRLPAGGHVQGIITRGGTATNIVPELAEGRFGLRSRTTSALHELIAQVTDLVQHTAQATGTRADVRLVRAPYAHFHRNEVLDSLFARHIEPHGIVMTEPEPGVYLGSSDIGNVSAAVPALHPFVAITGPEKSDHTPEFAAAAASPTGRTVALAAAQALAHTALDLLTDPEVVKAAWACQA